MTDKNAQISRIIAYIKAHGSISVGIAHSVLHIGNFGARMTDARHKGYVFSYVWKEQETDYGKCRYKEYFLEKEPA